MPQSEVPDAPFKGLVTHPAAHQPSFPWKIQLPSTWSYLVTDPSGEEMCITAILNDIFGPDWKEIDGVMDLAATLKQLAAYSRDHKILYTLIHPYFSAEELTFCVVLLHWKNFFPQTPNIEVGSRAFGTKAGYRRASSKYDNPYLFFYNQLDESKSWNCQTFTPVSESSWGCLISASTSLPELGEVMENIVIKMTESLEFHPHHEVHTSPQTEKSSVNENSD